MGWKENIVRGHHKTPETLADHRIINRIVALITLALISDLSDDDREELRAVMAEHDARGLGQAQTQHWAYAYDTPSPDLWAAAKKALEDRQTGACTQQHAAGLCHAASAVIAERILGIEVQS